MADSQKKLIILPDNPLCGISTYKDTLNLANGVCTRYVKKLVLTGNESGWVMSGTGLFYNLYLSDNPRERDAVMSTHFAMTHEGTLPVGTVRFGGLIESPSNPLVFNYDNGAIGLEAFKSWLASQYANGTPVTVWFIPTTATTETITVPTGLSGTEEGYLTQSGTPTPTNPVYPTANEVLIWQHSLRKLITATEAVENPLYSDGTAITSYTISGNTVQDGTPTPSTPIAVQGVGELDSGQYKIPISSPVVTTNIDLGSTQTVRQIYKLVLDGTENYGSSGANTWLILGTSTVDFRGTADGAICSHVPLVLRSDFTTNTCAWGGGQIGDFLINIDNKNNAELISYIAQQYANGTPVTVWYVLSSATTGTVNEPLMKIGDYVDTLSNATAIPTTEGANSITVDTTVQPSEFTATWTGWHNANVKEWDGSQWD